MLHVCVFMSNIRHRKCHFSSKIIFFVRYSSCWSLFFILFVHLTKKETSILIGWRKEIVWKKLLKKCAIKKEAKGNDRQAAVEPKYNKCCIDIVIWKTTSKDLVFYAITTQFMLEFLTSFSQTLKFIMHFYRYNFKLHFLDASSYCLVLLFE